MSEFVQGAIVAGAFALAGALVSQVFNLLLERRREEASYRVNLYDKRLAVHQQAFEWLMRAAEPLKRSEGENAKQHRDELASICAEADQWWNANCLYLDPQSRDKMLTFLIETRLWSENPNHQPRERHPIKLYRHAWLAVQQGIGTKHIDEKNLPKELQK